jgi:acyl carrier protein|tara:strand:+ start:2057 stop:2335 length:279 start_codon:yes stop_codon:yes gene_type:complete
MSTISNFEITYKIKKMMSKHLGIDVETITEQLNLIDDLGADSLDSIELIIALEEEFDILVDDAEAENAETVGSIITLVEQKINGINTNTNRR